MEQALFYVLGVLSMLVISSIYNMLKTGIQVKDLYDSIEDLHQVINDIDRTTDLLDRRIDQEIDRLNLKESKLYEYTDKLYQSNEKGLNDLYKYVDSRTENITDEKTIKHFGTYSPPEKYWTTNTTAD